MQKTRKTVETNREPVEASGSRWEAGGRQGRGRKGCGRVRRGAGGPEGRGKVRKRQEGTGSNGTLQYLPLKAKPSRPKCRAVINKVERNKSLVLHTHHHSK